MARFKVAVQAIANYVAGLRRSLRYGVESLFIVQPVEALTRFWCHLDPRVYSEPLRIKRISEGRIARKGNRHVLLVVYDKESIPAFIRTLMDAVGRSRLNLVIATNAKISPALRAALLEKCCLLIERADLGRDFGAYKDGISIIQKRFGPPDRLILLNDSLFYFEKGLDEFIEAFDGDAELIGMTEDVCFYYHIQSFALSFGPQVLANRRFQRYWRDYRPISTRRWAVRKGERNLTRQLLRAGFKPRILYPAAKLVPHMRKCEFGGLLESVRMLPSVAQNPLFRRLVELRMVQTTAPLPMLDTLSRSVRRLQKVAVADRSLQAANIGEILAISQRSISHHKHHEEWAVETLGERIVDAVADNNQMHFGGFLFMRYLNMPGVKRDIYFRELYPFEEVEEHFSHLPFAMKEEVMADIRRRGSKRLLTGIAWVLARHGSI